MQAGILSFFRMVHAEWLRHSISMDCSRGGFMPSRHELPALSRFSVTVSGLSGEHAPAAAEASAARAASGSSFYLAMRILRPAQRDAMYEIYAFCRAVDDIADGDAPAPQRAAELEVWRCEIDACYADTPSPACLSLYEQIQAFDLAREDFHAVIDGMMMDVVETIHAPSVAQLDLYCDRVASAVGRLSVRVFGMEREAGIALSHHLGRALQLTNILRDLDEDAAIRRLYLPREALQAAGIPTDASLDIAETVLTHPGLESVCRQMAEQAREHFRQANVIMARSPRQVVKAPRLMAAAYGSIFERMLARGWAAPRERVRLPRLQLLWAVLRYAVI